MMVKIINPIWDQTPKSGSKPNPLPIRDDGPMLKTSAQRRQEAEAAAEEQKAAEARFAAVAAQKRSEWEAAATARPHAGTSSHVADSSHAGTSSHVAVTSPFTSEAAVGLPGPIIFPCNTEATSNALHSLDPETCLSPNAVTQPKSQPVPQDAAPQDAAPQDAKPPPKTGVATGTPHAPKQKVPRRLGDLPPERRSIRAGYDLVRFFVTRKDPGLQDPGLQDPGLQDPGLQDPGLQDPGSQDPGSQDPGSQARFNRVTQHTITAPLRPQIVVCLQYPLPETGVGGVRGTHAKKARLAESAEARAAYIGEAIHFAEPLSISVAVVAGSAATETTEMMTKAEMMTHADTLIVVLTPTRYAPRVPKLSHVIALALSKGQPQERSQQTKERSPQASETTRDEESPQKEEPLGALELTKLCETGADVFLFAPHPFLTSPLFRGPDPARRPPWREFDRLPECPVPGDIRLLIPEIAVASKSIQRRLDAFLVDLYAGAPDGDLPALPASYLTKATNFNWGGLLEADPAAYKKAAAKQAWKVLLHLMMLKRDTS